jgi:serine/threonine protein kinase/serine phosphatase RsbU (regulator of sigma subunit)/pSer/pThr/pTyr-binding forkhead associated (FHA) protein
MADAPDEAVNYSFAVKFYTHGPVLGRPGVVGAVLTAAGQLRRVEGPFLARLHEELDLREYQRDGWPPAALVSRLIEPSLQLVLDELPRRGEGLPEVLVLRWARHLFEAVEALHGGYGLVHRDIKPANVLLQLPRGVLYSSPGALDGATALLADLGMACQAGEPPPWPLPQDGWKAPEGVGGPGAEGRACAATDDLFSLGLVLGHLVTAAVAGGERLATLGRAAEALADPDPARRLAAKHELRVLLFPETDRRTTGGDAVILRRSEARASGTLPPGALPAAAGEAADWVERDGIPGYAVLRKIGQGGMGVVYEARDLTLNRLVAVKTLWGRYEERYAVERLRVEAAALARLNHRGIVKIYGCHFWLAHPYLILERVAGPDLGSLVKAGGPLSPEKTVQIAEALALALEHAHEQGVIHRDPKPSNVLLGDDGTPKLIDFGLAKLLDAQADLTSPGMVMGTPQFMAPELVHGADQADARSDLYSLGATIYYLLTGRPPLEAARREELLRALVVQEPIRPRLCNPAVPADLEAVCLRCLAKSPEDRFATAGALAGALRAIRQLQEGAGAGGGRESAVAANGGRVTDPRGGAALAAAGGASLQILKGPNEGAVLPIDGDRFVLGRNPDCGVVIPVTSVSREHAQIVRVAGKYFIEDKRSRSGTFVNNQAINARTPLRHNDRIRICDWIAAFRDGGAGSPIAEEDFPSSVGPLSLHTSQVLLDAEKPALLLDIANLLARTLELSAALPQLADKLFRLFRQADRCFLIQAGEGDTLVPRVVKTRRAADESTGRFSKNIVRQCLQTGRAFLSDDASRDDRIPPSQGVVDFRIRSVMCAPLSRGDGNAFGVLQLDTLDRSKKFTQEDLKLLCGVANQASIALENARLLDEAVNQERLQRDLQLARRVQEGFLPHPLPDVPGYEFFGRCESRGAVGGDYYDCFPRADGKVVVTVGDVAGTGVAAAMLATAAMLEARRWFETESDPALAVARLNDALYRITSPIDRFVTHAAAVIDPATHVAILVNGGHPPPLLYRPRSGELFSAMDREIDGPPLGMISGLDFDSCQISLEPGDSLLLYTDGVDESANTRGEQFKMAGIERVVKGCGNAGPQEVVERLFAALAEHEAGRDRHDDQTAFVVKRC